MYWPNALFRIEGENIDVHLENLIINGIHANSDVFGGYDGTTILSEYGERNKIVVNNCVMSHFVHVALWNFGQSTDFSYYQFGIQRSVVLPRGMFFGGVLWGAGSWTGTMDTLEFRQNTVSGILGEAFVLFEHVDQGVIDHNTFSNVMNSVLFDQTANNIGLQITCYT